jgi:hypothetical protein
MILDAAFGNVVQKQRDAEHGPVLRLDDKFDLRCAQTKARTKAAGRPRAGAAPQPERALSACQGICP